MSAFKRRKKGKFLLAIAAAAIISMAICLTVVYAGQPIKIGVAYGLQGLWSDWCKKNLVAIDMAVEEIMNARGRSPGGR